MPKLAARAEEVERLVLENHGYRSTIAIAMDEAARSPNLSPRETANKVAARIFVATWDLSEGLLSDQRVIQWACHVGLITEERYRGLTGKRSDEPVTSAGREPRSAASQCPGVSGDDGASPGGKPDR